MQEARGNRHLTPTLDNRLAILRRRLVSKVWLHGLGTILGAAAIWLTFAYLADWALRVPRPVRVMHGLVFPAVVSFFLWRDFLRPLKAIPGRAGLALLIERGSPELRELLISAVELQDRELKSEDPTLVARVLEEAELAAGQVSPTVAVDDRPPRNRFLLGGALASLLAVAGALNPEHAGIFIDRMVGGSRPWPQRTRLLLEIPDLGSSSVVEVDGQSYGGPDDRMALGGEDGSLIGERMHLRVARGSDVPILIRSEGLEPDRVTIHFEGGRELELQSAGAGLFRTLLRSLQEDISFHVTGGDDRDGLPEAQITVLQPPDIEGLAMIVTPPAYSGLPEARFENRDIEVLAGSTVRVHVLPFPAQAGGRARFFPALPGGPVSLSAAAYPAPVGSETDAQTAGLFFELTPERSVGFHIELLDDSGLENPDPGLFRIEVIEDRAPEMRVLSPARSDFEVVLGGSIPLRVRAEDDFGVVALDYEVRGTDQNGTAFTVAAGSLTPRAIDAEVADGRILVLGSERIEVDALAHAELPVAVDQRYELVFRAIDTRAPDANEGTSHPLRARVVTPEELLRRMQDRLAQARLIAVRLTDLQREKRRRVEELLGAFESDGIAGSEAGAVAAAMTGQRRVRADALSLARELAVVAEDVLYARLDPKAGHLLEYYDARQQNLVDLRYHAGPMRELAAALASGELASSGFATNLIQLVELSLVVSEDHAARAVAALEAADKAIDRQDIQDALVLALEEQLLAEDRLEDLLQELSVWDNFQNVLALTRDILNRQKALRQRTQQFASEK